ncbi:MAG TPA: SMI1/KNR4 family protein [Polyangiaceae bacterium]|nr:SMI1/KNR4 family protein [Polyangiaceae bacterium]
MAKKAAVAKRGVRVGAAGAERGAQKAEGGPGPVRRAQGTGGKRPAKGVKGAGDKRPAKGAWGTPAGRPATSRGLTSAGASRAAKGGDVAAYIALVERRAKASGVTLPKGATRAALARAEAALGVALPDEMRAFYQAHDGGGDEFVVEGRELLSLRRIVNEWRVWKGLLDRGTFEANDHGQPGPGVRGAWWLPEWVPITYDGAGNHHVVDLAPAAGGTRGQIVSFWHDEASRRVVGPSFLAWLSEAEWTPPA